MERGSPALKQFLTHLERLVHDPFLRSAASEAVVVNDKFSSKSNYFAMFQLERVRLLRAGVKMDNNNLEQAVKILHEEHPEIVVDGELQANFACFINYLNFLVKKSLV